MENLGDGGHEVSVGDVRSDGLFSFSRVRDLSRDLNKECQCGWSINNRGNTLSRIHRGGGVIPSLDYVLIQIPVCST